MRGTCPAHLILDLNTTAVMDINKTEYVFIRISKVYLSNSV